MDSTAHAGQGTDQQMDSSEFSLELFSLIGKGHCICTKKKTSLSISCKVFQIGDVYVELPSLVRIDRNRETETEKELQRKVRPTSSLPPTQVPTERSYNLR